MNAVEIKKLSYNYPCGKKALSNIDLEIGEKDSLAILGPNGAGKTTLILHLNGTIESNGCVRVLGKKPREARLSVGVVFQDPNDQLFSPTLYEDVAFGPVNQGLGEETVEKRTLSALEKVGLKGRGEEPPHHLSYGEKKRASIATVLSMKPRILVLDEPTSNLDPPGKKSLAKLLNSIRTTKIIATHDLEFAAKTCKKAVILKDGEKRAEGKTLCIVSDEKLLKKNGLC